MATCIEGLLVTCSGCCFGLLFDDCIVPILELPLVVENGCALLYKPFISHSKVANMARLCGQYPEDRRRAVSVGGRCSQDY